MSEPEKIDWIEELERRFGGPVEIGGPAPPDPCRDCGQPVDLSERELYSVPRRKTCRPCMKARADESRRRALDGTIPPRYAWARLDAAELRERVKAGVPSPEKIDEILRADRVVFAGKAGSGKTSLAVALLREAARRGSEAMFVPAYRLATARARHPLGEGEPPLLEMARSVGVLLVDDVGNEQDTKLSDVRSVIFERHDYERPIWVTTALSGRELGPAYGGGFLRRIGERAIAIDCGGEAGK